MRHWRSYQLGLTLSRYHVAINEHPFLVRFQIYFQRGTIFMQSLQNPPKMATTGILMAGLTGLAAFLYGPPTHRALSKFGVFRSLSSIPLANPDDLVILKDTTHCEDVHYYAPAHTLFTACEDVSTTRFQWFPPLGTFSSASVAWNSKGSIHIIDPEVSRFTNPALGRT